MTPPNITKGEWIPKQYRSGTWGVRSPMCAVAKCIENEDLDEATARFMSASKAMAEALLVVCACGEPEKTSLYDEEGVEGWKWTHPDGREWTCIGDWNEPAPMHPVAHAALLQAGYTE